MSAEARHPGKSLDRSPMNRLVLLCLAVASSLPAADFAVVDLRCENAKDPLGVDRPAPWLSWRLAAAEGETPPAGLHQTAWQVRVAATREGLGDAKVLWDSGRRDGDATRVDYAGEALESSQSVWWQLRAWNGRGEASAWSEPASWTMGLLEADDWEGGWIVAPWVSESLLLRKEFEVRPGLERAILHVTGLGQYEAWMNGERLGDDLLSPGWTNYDRTVLYDTREVTGKLRPGTNAIGLALGNGIYHVQRRNRFAKFMGSFGPLRAIAHLRLEYADGRTETVGTDPSWRVDPGPVTYSNIYGGEDFDARRLEPGWNRPGFEDSSWENAVSLVRPTGTLRGLSHAAEPLGAIEEREPVEVRAVGDGAILYDFGQNTSFMPRITVSGPAGSTVRLEPGETVNDDGTIHRGTMGGNRGSSWWQYTKRSDGPETWLPQFHYIGSRFVRATLEPAAEDGERPAVDQLTMVVVHSTARPRGSFACSNPRLNRIHQLVRWAQRSNMVSVLTDCPHREKLGWIEQYHLNGPSIRHEFDVARIYAKGMRDMAEAQTPEGMVPNIAPEYVRFEGAFRSAAEWGAAFILVPWQQYLYEGDLSLAREHWEAMTRYHAYLESRVGEDGLLGDGLGDWYDLLLGKKGRANLTPAPITATAFLAEDARVLARLAAALGRDDEAETYAAKAAAVRERWIAAFRKADPLTYGTDHQASMALALALGLAEEEDRPALLERLVADVEERGYATAGDVGFRFLLRALADGGRSDVVYQLINQDEKPGYGYQIKQGATALTEAWDANLGASHNHFMLGQVIEWFHHDLVGLQPDPAAPGWKHAFLRPTPVGDLKWAEASHQTPHGRLFLHWERSGEQLDLHIVVPPNTTATLEWPDGWGGSVELKPGEYHLGAKR